jgi:coproporphyrinogen III oxidase
MQIVHSPIDSLPPVQTLPRDFVVDWVREVQDRLTDFFTRADGGGTFREDAWDRPGGGGGWARVLVEGETFEKAGVNRSVVEGVLTPDVAHRLGGRTGAGDDLHFLAAGVSVVVHPRSPRIPTVHLNVRYFEISDRDGTPVDAWLGGGTDLTPTYPDPQDAVHFHRTLKALCDRHHPAFFPRFKAECDAYFVNTHRGNERRGIGGIFFDTLRGGEDGLGMGALHAFTHEVGVVLDDAYGPVVERCRDLPWGEEERTFQLQRRGRYVEFNLVHDRGTVFGLRTNARMESVLMSLPPLARWDYDPRYGPGSFQDRLMAMLEPRDWAAGE